ncbi:hypothetical protein [Enterobacter phage 04_vB_Eclo_IJM]|nr:hypothetical protein [Enterobacter phage 02_vB_Eclo_IJM]UZT50471.1 hypothetical protein [Enterobacter phage 04_vB_Eclo_IJM]
MTPQRQMLITAEANLLEAVKRKLSSRRRPTPS